MRLLRADVLLHTLLQLCHQRGDPPHERPVAAGDKCGDGTMRVEAASTTARNVAAHMTNLIPLPGLVAQRYINPVLLDGHKFDVRVCAVVLRTSPLQVAYHSGYARVCVSGYTSPSDVSYPCGEVENLLPHQTNISVQRKHPHFSSFRERAALYVARAHAPRGFGDMAVGPDRSFESLAPALSRSVCSTCDGDAASVCGQKLVQELEEQMIRRLRTVFRQWHAREFARDAPCLEHKAEEEVPGLEAFQVFGADFLVVRRGGEHSTIAVDHCVGLTPLLLEVCCRCLFVAMYHHASRMMLICEDKP